MTQAWTSPDLAPLLVDEATKKSGLVWVSGDPSGHAARAVWLLWHDDQAFILSGPGEQPAPAVGTGGLAWVTVRSKDKGNRLVTWEASVTALDPAGADWAAVAPLLLAKRLNLPDLHGAAQRWAAECRIDRLVPTGRLTQTPDVMPADSLASPPPPSPAATDVPMPFTVGASTRKKPRRDR